MWIFIILIILLFIGFQNQQSECKSVNNYKIPQSTIQKQMVKFKEQDHIYESVETDNIKWQSVTSIVKLFEEEFDVEAKALSSSKNKKSKWYGKNPEDIKAIWKRTNEESVTRGNWYHREREKQICGVDSIERDEINCSISKPIIKDGIKYAPDQKLDNYYIYPEHFVYLKSVGICGQSDLVEVRNNKVYITDYKTNKNFTTKGYTNWKGITTKLLSPLNHLEECKLNVYNIQLSLYMYIILKHNPQLSFGKLIIQHIIFKEIDRDSNDNPIYDRDSNNEPIIEKIVSYELPYLKDEVLAILNYLKKK